MANTMKKIFCSKYGKFVASIGNLKNLEYHTSQKKTTVFCIIYCNRKNEEENIFKKKDHLKY